MSYVKAMPPVGFTLMTETEAVRVRTGLSDRGAWLIDQFDMCLRLEMMGKLMGDSCGPTDADVTACKMLLLDYIGELEAAVADERTRGAA